MTAKMDYMAHVRESITSEREALIRACLPSDFYRMHPSAQCSAWERAAREAGVSPSSAAREV